VPNSMNSAQHPVSPSPSMVVRRPPSFPLNELAGGGASKGQRTEGAAARIQDWEKRRRVLGGGNIVDVGNRRGLLPKNIDQQVGRRAVICKLFPPIAMAIRSRSCVFDESFYSLHNYLSFHLIHSPTKNTTKLGLQFLPHMPASKNQLSILSFSSLYGR
jgi:hypothetical protein